MTDSSQWITTHCSRMDHGGCRLKVLVEKNRILKISGDHSGILSRGHLCAKGRAMGEKRDHPLRLTHPLRRTGPRGSGQWEQISWPDALECIRDNLDRIRQKHGAGSVAFCQGMPKGLEHFVLIRLANLFGSPNVVAVQDVCHAPREIAGLLTCGFYPVPDFTHPTRLILLWGSNIVSTNEEGSICRLPLEQIRQGAELIVVDPCRTPLAEKADLWLQIKPGTDLALALAMLQVITSEQLFDQDFVHTWTSGLSGLEAHVRPCTPEHMAEVTGVPAQSIREAARRYARARPATLGWGNPIEHTVNAFDASRSLVLLMALCGNLDVPGGNIRAIEPGTRPPGQFVLSRMLPDKRRTMLNAHHQTLPGLMTVPPAYFRRAVLQNEPYPVRGAYIQCSNPMLTWAESELTRQSLMALDFCAVSEVVMTPTAQLADLVLPAATSPEFNDIGHYGLGHGLVLARPKVFDPPGHCWPDMKILNELGKMLTPENLWFSDHEDLLDHLLEPAGLDFQDLVRHGVLKGEKAFQIHERTSFKTRSGLVELQLAQADRLGQPPYPEWDGPPEDPDPNYPLLLTTAKSRVFLHSSYRWVPSLRKRHPSPRCLIHPETAASLGITDNAPVRIETRSGAMTQVAHLTDRIRPDVVQADYGWWFPEAEAAALFQWDLANYNLLTSTSWLGRAFGTPNLKGLNCRIRPAGADSGCSEFVD